MHLFSYRTQHFCSISMQGLQQPPPSTACKLSRYSVTASISANSSSLLMSLSSASFPFRISYEKKNQKQAKALLIVHQYNSKLPKTQKRRSWNALCLESYLDAFICSPLHSPCVNATCHGAQQWNFSWLPGSSTLIPAATKRAAGAFLPCFHVTHSFTCKSPSKSNRGLRNPSQI